MKNNNNNNQAAHWVDKVAQGIISWQQKNKISKLHVDDMKTPSGRVHTGSLVGVILHDLIAKALEENEKEVTSTYVFNDMDPMDGLPSYLDSREYQTHMGKPLFNIPAPNLEESGIDLTTATTEEIEEFKSAKNFAQFYALDFIHALRKLGCDQEIVWSHELYQSGSMDKIIREALDKVDLLKKVYKEIAEYDLPDQWYPFQVICPECGKLGTTHVTGWDGQKVTYECQTNKVEWAQGCGHQGQISPFGGNGKLLWKVDWPAHWKNMGVTVEGAGKDHSSAGGSRDMANAQCEQVFNIPAPFDIPYEWILVRGTKMSSSKGIGTSAREFTELFPPSVGRFLFTNKHYNQVLDFDPQTMSIPDLFDLYDLGARISWQEETGDLRLGRSFELSQIGKKMEQCFLPRFRDIALWMQHPELDLAEKFAEVKGSTLNETELKVLEERKHYAQIWVDRYAPSEYQLSPQTKLPEEAKELTQEQKVFLQAGADLLEEQPNWNPQDLQQALFDLAKATLGAKQGFQAIYLAFIGKKSGPRAAWFLLSIDKDLLKSRIKELNQS